MKSRHFMAMAFVLILLTPDAGHAWVSQTVDSVGAVGLFTSMALDSSDKVHISYIDWTNEMLKYANNISGSWDHQVVAPTGPPGQGVYTSIALDSSEAIHVSYADWTNKDLKYATNASGDWETTTVDSVGDVGLYASMVLDSDGKAHISYYDATNDNLKHATQDGPGGWTTEAVDSTGQVGLYTSIAVDSSDKAHISYHDATNGGLKYAVQDGFGGWVIKIVDSMYPAGMHTSIALDSSDKAHISYYDEYYSKLKYATNASGDWVTVGVDSPQDVGWDTSIALDSLGSVHISYYHATNGDLKYATNASGDWVRETVASSGDVGEYTSIALDSLGNVHISYSDRTREDLKYVNNACIDNDGDGYGDPADPLCPHPEMDCDDTDPGRHPNAAEACDGKDNDCDGEVPEDEVDEDEDYYMVCANDCEDDNPDVNPGVREEPFGGPLCSDLVDNDCDELVDEQDSGCCECIDNDRDGYGEPGCIACPHSQPDCDDTEPDVNPGADEVCGEVTCRDGLDNDCDGRIDDDDPDCETWCPIELGASTIGKTDYVNCLFLLVPFAAIFILKRLRRRV